MENFPNTKKKDVNRVRAKQGCYGTQINKQSKAEQKFDHHYIEVTISFLKAKIYKILFCYDILKWLIVFDYFVCYLVQSAPFSTTGPKHFCKSKQYSQYDVVHFLWLSVSEAGISGQQVELFRESVDSIYVFSHGDFTDYPISSSSHLFLLPLV